MTTLVLGCDVGIRNPAFAVVDMAPQRPVVVRTAWDALHGTLEERITQVSRLEDVLWEDVIEGTVCLVAVEDQRGAIAGHQQRGTTNADALQNLIIQGAMMAIANCYCAPDDVVLVDPRKAKNAVGCGSHADKAAVQRAVKLVTGYSAPTEHEADAVAIAIAGWRMWRRR